MQVSSEAATARHVASTNATKLPFRSFAIFAWSVLAYNVLVILWGALVRATGSGAGCGGHWPLCNGAVLPEVSQVATAIEFTHRIMSGLSLISVAVMFGWAWKSLPKGHRARKWAAWSVFFILTEALIGAALVLLGHVAKDQSVGRVYSLATHLINTFLLLASMALTAWWATVPSRPGKSEDSTGSTGSMYLAISAVVAVAVAGAITALGDTLFPPQTLAQGLVDDFSAASSFLVRLRVIHPALAVSAGAFLAVLGIRAYRRARGRELRVLGGLLFGLVLAEIAAGTSTVLMKAPIPMQLAHLLIADCLWITLVLFSAENLRQNR
jgi:cytochrome c oxidase assembly protein subunit 15